jgi:protocatechuate 3,4-dioxygenase beta subunit
VVDVDSHQPLAAVRITLGPAGKSDAVTTLITGEAGRFTFSGLAAGKYALSAQRRGYVAQSFNQRDSLSSSIVVGPNLDSSHLVFSLVLEGGISGSIVDEQGEAVRMAFVYLFQCAADGRTVRRGYSEFASTDDEGHYHFSHLRAGRYYVAVRGIPWYRQPPQIHTKVTDAQGVVTDYSGDVDEATLKGAQKVDYEEEPPTALDVAYPVTFYGGATDSSAATPILVGKGEKVSADIVLQPVPAAHWQFTQPPPAEHFAVLLEQRLFDGILVQAFPMPRRLGHGVLEYTGMAPGHFRFDGWGPSPSGRIMVHEEFDVGANGEIEKQTSTTYVPVSATIRFEPPAAPTESINLQLRQKNSNHGASLRMNGKSEIEFPYGVERGSFYEVAVDGGSGIYLRSVQATGAKLTGHMLEVKDDSPIKLTVVLATGRGSIAGVAVREDKPIAGAMIVLVPADPGNNTRLLRREETNSDGSFSFTDVVPGRYTLLAIDDGWELEWTNPVVLEKYMAQGEPITVEAKGKYSVKVKVQ